MQLPMTIRILGGDYRVEWMKKWDPMYKTANGYYAEGKIVLHPRLSKRTRALTLLHEMLHVMLDSAKLSRKVEERIVQQLEKGFRGLYQEEGKVMRAVGRDAGKRAITRKNRKKT